MNTIFIASDFLDQLLTYTIDHHASDIHIEALAQGYKLRTRHDGLLRTYSTLTIDQGQALVSRLKILAHLDIAEKRLPQDGKLFYQKFPQHDFRISTCPTVFGEKIVIRYLNTTQTSLNINELGMNLTQLNLFENALQQPQGLILITGPTGSGKTVTINSALQYLNKISLNIVTIEDPVEIFLEGINQINVNPKAGLTFPSILKSILRQDPDIIMIGEMRDYETAELALTAAQTGHLVLATLHTNNTIDSITRLLQMGFANYQIHSALKMIIAQRLVRVLCPHCKKTSDNSADNANIKSYYPTGCSHCHDGYRGRTGLYEVLTCDDNVTHTIQQQDTKALQSYRQQIFTLEKHGLQKVEQAITSVAEIKRVLGEL